MNIFYRFPKGNGPKEMGGNWELQGILQPKQGLGNHLESEDQGYVVNNHGY